MKNSFVELHARQRVEALLDDHLGHELVGPFDQMTSPYLLAQNIVPESDDGMIITQGQIDGTDVVVIAMEAKFQGGGIGEIAGAKFIGALTHALHENQNNHRVVPIILLDTGGVRLQEANYGLLSISEIGNLIVALKQYVPVIGVVPGLVGSFGGMSITAALMSYLIATKKARIGLNGPEVIEQEAGVREFDANDKDLIWNTLGAKQRLAAQIVDELVDDSVENIKAAVIAAMQANKDTHRSANATFYLSLLPKLDLSKPLPIAEYNATLANHTATPVALPVISEGQPISNPSAGYQWFQALGAFSNPHSSMGTVYYGPTAAFSEAAVLTAVVADKENVTYRVRNGEVGLYEGFTLAQILEQVYQEDQAKVVKRPVIALIDVPSQAYGYNEELIGIHVSLANAAQAYAKLRQAGHPVIGVIVGNAISGAFLAHGLQANRLIALNSTAINVQAMSKDSASRVTKRSVAEIEAAAAKVPAIAYDIQSFNKLGAVYKLLTEATSQAVTTSSQAAVVAAVNEAISDIRTTNDTMLTSRYDNPIAINHGRVETNKVFAKMNEEWTK